MYKTQTNYNRILNLPFTKVLNETEYETHCKDARFVYCNTRVYSLTDAEEIYQDIDITKIRDQEIMNSYHNILRKFENEIYEEINRSELINKELCSIFERNPKNLECFDFIYETSIIPGKVVEIDFNYNEFRYCANLVKKNDYTLDYIGYIVLNEFDRIYRNIKKKIKTLTFDENNIDENGEAFLSKYYDLLEHGLITLCLSKGIKLFYLDGKIAIKEPNKELVKNLSNKEAEESLSNITGSSNITCGNSETADIGPFNLMSFHSTYKPNIKKMFYKDEVTGKYMYNTYFEHEMNTIASTINDEDCDIVDEFFNHICCGEKEANHVKNQLKVSIKTGIAPNDINVFVVDSYSYGIDLFYNNILAPLNNGKSLRLHANELLHKFTDKSNGKSLIYINQIPTPFDKLDEQILQYNLSEMFFNKESICSVFIVTTETSYLNIADIPESFSVIKANFDFKSSNYLNTGSLQAMIQKIKEKLPIFFKKCMSEDVKEYPALENDTKTSISKKGNRVNQHLNAYKMEDIEFFKPLHKSTNPEHNKLYEDLAIAFNSKVPYVSQQNITRVYNAMENTDESEKAVIEKFKAMDKIFFHDENFTRQPNSDKRYKIRSQFNDLFKSEDN